MSFWLPANVLEIIFTFLDTKDVLRAMAKNHGCIHLSQLLQVVCKMWYNTVQHHHTIWAHRTIDIPVQPEKFQDMINSLSRKDCVVQRLNIWGKCSSQCTETQ